jgi:hypothetical protein
MASEYAILKKINGKKAYNAIKQIKANCKKGPGKGG